MNVAIADAGPAAADRSAVALPSTCIVFGRSPAWSEANPASDEPLPLTASPAPSAGVLTGCYVIPDAFSAEQCARIRSLEDRSQRERAAVVSGLTSYRRSSLIAVPRKADGLSWLIRRVAWLFAWANAHLFRFSVAGIDEDPQLLRYDVDDFFAWHVDCGEGPISTRKLSMSVQLSAPTDYDGGVLAFPGNPRPQMARLQGAATIFPAYLAHHVTPVTRGVRYSLVAWAHGPPFS